MKCRLVAYRRVSTGKQGRSGLGLDAQEAAVAAYVESSGCELIATYTEVESGRRSDRIELRKAIAHAKRARATLVIAKLDRLSRSVAFIATLLEKGGVDFVACDNPQVNPLMVHILAAVAEQEARAISQRTKDALAVVKARGSTKDGHTWAEVKAHSKFNLTRAGTLLGAQRAAESHKIAKAEAYADLLPSLKTMRASGLSYAAIAEQLNAEGQVTRRNCSWNAAQVRRALTT